MLKLLLLILILSSLFCFYLRDLRFASEANFDAYGDPSQIGTISDPSLTEISGITPSRTGKGLWWVHNDSGDQARLYVINSSGKLLARFTVTGARHRDWEDMAGFVAKDGKPALYIADIGDNGLNRSDTTIYSVKEPDLSKGVKDAATEAVEALPFRYPDGRHDAEALFVDPKSGRPYIVTKTMSPPCGIYRFPLPLRPNERVTLQKVDGQAAERISKLIMVTGAATSPDGSRVVVRTYFGAFEMTRAKSTPFETIFKSSPETIKLPLERQGEAISYTADGKSIITTSEKLPSPIFKMSRR